MHVLVKVSISGRVSCARYVYEFCNKFHPIEKSERGELTILTLPLLKRMHHGFETFFR